MVIRFFAEQAQPPRVTVKRVGRGLFKSTHYEKDHTMNNQIDDQMLMDITAGESCSSATSGGCNNLLPGYGD